MFSPPEAPTDPGKDASGAAGQAHRSLPWAGFLKAFFSL